MGTQEMNTFLSHAPVLMVAIPMVSAFVALLGKALHGTRWWRGLSIVVFLPSFAVLAWIAPEIWQGRVITYALGGFVAEPGIPLVIDGLAWVSSLLVAVVGTLVMLVSLSHASFGVAYFFFLHMAVVGMQGVVVTGDIFTMFVSFEIVALAVYVLIAWEQSDEGLLASLKYLFLSSVGILFFLIGTFLLYRDFGSLSFSTLSRAVAQWRESVPTDVVSSGIGVFTTGGVARSLTLAVAALCVGIGVRTAFIPFHTWLPEAHSWAPHPISALLSGVLIKVSFLALVRLVVLLGAWNLQPVLMWVGVITALVAVVWALSQQDAKRLLAYHSISQMGYILAAWGAGGALGVCASYAHAISHALFKGLLFVVVGIMIERTGTRDVYRMRRAAYRSPLLLIGLLTGALAISGVPPFNGFVSKHLVSQAVYGTAAYTILKITSIGTAASFLKLSLVLVPAPHGATPAPTVARLSRWEALAIGAFVLLVITTGVYGRPLLTALSRMVQTDQNVVLPSLYTAKTVWNALWPLFVGGGVTVLVMTQRGRELAHHISDIAPQLRTVLLFFVVGLILFAVVPLI